MLAQIYWLHLPEHTSILSQGYVGVSNNPGRRLSEHKYSKDNYNLSKLFEEYVNLEQTVLLIAEEDYCYEIEKKLRPYPEIGWNISPGGHRGPPSKKGRKHNIKHHYWKATPTSFKEGHVPWNKNKTKETDPRLEIVSRKNKGNTNKQGKIHSVETNQKISNAARCRPTVICPTCGVSGQRNAMFRWHFNNCRERQ